jgi:hypothetical protein
METFNTRQTVCILVAGFSFLILSAYLILWSHSNRDFRIVVTVAILFILGVLFAPRKDLTIGTAFLFAGLRWGFAAIVTHELRAIIATVIFLSVPAAMLYLDSRKQKPIL